MSHKINKQDQYPRQHFSTTARSGEVPGVRDLISDIPALGRLATIGKSVIFGDENSGDYGRPAGRFVRPPSEAQNHHPQEKPIGTVIDFQAYRDTKK